MNPTPSFPGKVYHIPYFVINLGCLTQMVYATLIFKGELFMLKRAMLESASFIGIMLALDVLAIPIDLLTHRPILNGLITNFVQSSNRATLLGSILAVAIGCWLVLTLIIWFFLSLNHNLAKHDYKK
jgi:hypothetical protein